MHVGRRRPRTWLVPRVHFRNEAGDPFGKVRGEAALAAPPPFADVSLATTRLPTSATVAALLTDQPPAVAPTARARPLAPAAAAAIATPLHVSPKPSASPSATVTSAAAAATNSAAAASAGQEDCQEPPAEVVIAAAAAAASAAAASHGGARH